MNPKVTIAIPVYNAVKTLELAIKSVLIQTFRDWELIVINDGSTDGSMNIVHSIKDDRIIIIDDGINKGLVDRLNSIPKMANGKYLVRMDADDIMHPERLQKQFAYLEANPAVDIIDSGIYTIDEDNKIKGKRNVKWALPTDLAALKSCLFTHPAIMGKTSWFIQHSYDDQYRRAEDYELWIRAFKVSKYDRVLEPLLFYREGNVSVSNYVNSMKSVRKIFSSYGPKLMGASELRKEIIKTYLKQYTYLLFGMFNLQRLLLKSRNIAPPKSEIAEYNLVIRKISDFKIPV